MVDNKKLKLPQHLQLDSVSPATKLLEKRRAMYEVQTAFEDSKEIFQQKEEKFRQKEAELRDKDILIQDHLIRFSTYLQQQEIKRKKDQELAEIERQKIQQKNEEIEQKKQQLEILKQKAYKIERKVKSMRQFETFLEKVKEQNSDEFGELNDILSRYATLKDSNDKLQKSQKEFTEQQDQLNKQIALFNKQMSTKKLTMNNKIAVRQQKLENIEDQKGKLLAESEDKTQKKMQLTTQHGQILMSIENLYQKCLERKLFITKKSNQNESGAEKDPPKNFDDMILSGKNSIIQLNVIKNCLDNFIKLKKCLDTKSHIYQELNDRRNKQEIV